MLYVSKGFLIMTQQDALRAFMHPVRIKIYAVRNFLLNY